jgi:hypothetical protein
MQRTLTNFEVLPTHSEMGRKCTEIGHVNCKLIKETRINSKTLDILEIECAVQDCTCRYLLETLLHQW